VVIAADMGVGMAVTVADIADAVCDTGLRMGAWFTLNAV
jgi:hypothetical protein